MKKQTMINDYKIATKCLCLKLRATSRKVSRAYDEALRPAGINVNQFTILVTINLMKSGSISQLATILEMDRTTLTRNLRPLKNGRLIKQRSGRGRATEVSLTAKGTSVLDAARPLWQTAHTSLTKQLGSKQANSLGTLLSHITEK